MVDTIQIGMDIAAAVELDCIGKGAVVDIAAVQLLLTDAFVEGTGILPKD